MQYIKIPEERLSVLIGTKGKTKKDLESRGKAKLTVDDTTVTIEGEPMDEWKMKDVVHAIGRGFSPDKARMLLNDDYVFEIVELKDYAGTPKTLERLKGRVIGEKGKTRKFLERTTGVMVSVYGKTISLIGAYDEVALAREAVSMLLSGSRHSAVYKFLEKNVKRQKTQV